MCKIASFLIVFVVGRFTVNSVCVAHAVVAVAHAGVGIAML